MRRHETLDLLIHELEKYGLKGQVDHLSKHIELSWESPGHGHRFVTVASTPSDHRSSMNARAQLRRLIREDNLQPIQKSPLSYQHAMSLPKEPVISKAELEAAALKDVEVLTDLIFELQEAIIKQQEHIDWLEQRMSSVTVVSHVQFGERAPVQTFEKSVEREITAREIMNAARLPRPGSLYEKVYRTVPQEFTARAEVIRKLPGVNEKHVQNYLSKLKNSGLIESDLGHRVRRI